MKNVNINKNVEEELKKASYEKAHERYGKKLPLQVEERLEDELKKISKFGYASCYLLAAKVTEECKRLGEPYIVRGSVGSSLVAFLMGITETNPLPPHFYCPSCGHTNFEYWKIFGEEEPEAGDENDSGFDLVSVYQSKIKCEKCGQEYIGDGHDLPFESFAGFYGEKFPHIEIDVPKGAKNKLLELINNMPITAYYRELVMSGTGSMILNIFENSMLSLLKELQSLTGVSAESIPIDGVGYNTFFNEKEYKDVPVINEVPESIIDGVFCCSLSGIVRMLGYYHGTGVWEDNAKRLLEEEPYNLKRTIAHREDVMHTLMRHGIEREDAYRIMEIVRKGKAAEKLTEEDLQNMREKGVSEEYIESMMKIKYLFPKAHDTEFAIKIFKLIWYKVHYPEEFKMATGKSF